MSTIIGDDLEFSATALISDSEVPIVYTPPSYPPNRLVDRNRAVRANNPGLISLARQYAADPVYGTLYSPYAACDAEYCQYEGDEWDRVAWVYGRFFGPDGPPRGQPRENSLQRFTGKVSGQGANVDWRVTFGYSQSERTSTWGATMSYRDKRGLEGLAGEECEETVPNEYIAQGILDFSLDTLAQHAWQGACRFWIPSSTGMWGSWNTVLNGIDANPIFEPNLDNRDIQPYKITPSSQRDNTSFTYVEGVINGTWSTAMFPEINYAIGTSLRNDTYDSEVPVGFFNDAIAYPCSQGPEIKFYTAGRNGLVGFLPPSFPIDEARCIQAIYSEIAIALSPKLDFNFAIRLENYGTETGKSVDPKAALRWLVSDT